MRTFIVIAALAQIAVFTLLTLTCAALTGCQTTEPERERPPVEYSMR